ncbi:MAG: hypothetical protein ACI31F_08650, partial [Muribaculaceae bacterium]
SQANRDNAKMQARWSLRQSEVNRIPSELAERTGITPRCKLGGACGNLLTPGCGRGEADSATWGCD